MPTAIEHVTIHRQAGRRLVVGRVETFVREEGQGDPVVCLHGVPVSSYLWRKVLCVLASRGLRGIAFDLPGLGLADRPTDFDYSWTGLGGFACAAIDALGLERFHLVVHDVGGPVGFEVCAAMPDRIQSLTILNTIMNVDGFKKPKEMAGYAIRGVGELMLAAMGPWAFKKAMYKVGVSDASVCTPEELVGHLLLLKDGESGRGDKGRAFLKIMRAFEPNADKQALYQGAIEGATYPKMAIWGERDPALSVDTHGETARKLVGDGNFHRLPALHFLQETHASDVGALIASFVSKALGT